jgi:1-aminocyclopropane-1-carboxylate deaminase/D-cysteine desulfhydrase-like pyridoxal-dependent ACC family enzyme
VSESIAAAVPPAIAARPRFPLLDGPSPLQPLSRLSDALGARADLWIKREDRLPLPFGGNKVRNLEFLVGEAVAQGADTLITAGRPWSNHCRLTAAAGAIAGLAVHLVMTGPPRSERGPNERLCALLGATVHVAPTDARADREALVAEVADGVRGRGGRPFVIGVGGSGPTGALGQVLAGLEVAAQVDAIGVAASTVVLPTATGGTQAGLLVGVALAGLDAEILGMAVAHPARELAPALEALLGGLVAAVGPIESPIGPVAIEDGWLGDGYGRPSRAAAEATSLLARSEGILVDPIYTAKALAGFVAGVREGRFDGRTVVFWHAGGLTGPFEPGPLVG